MNKTLLFFSKINFGNTQNKGYYTKISSQSNALRKQGWDVDLLYVFNNEVRLENHEGYSMKVFKSRIQLLYYLFVTFAINLKAHKYKAIYIRHFLTNPLFLFFLMNIKPKVNNIILEVPTYPYSFEYKGINKNRLLYLIDKFCSYFFWFWIDRIVTFSFDKQIFRVPTIQTDNGVDVTSINFNNSVPKLEGALRILGLGNPRIWHAYERLIEGLNEYNKNPNQLNVVFEIVGQGGDLNKYINLVEKYNLEDKVIFHGYKSGVELDSICNRCHIAVASLGMHRINVANGEASPLKAREFAARGLPFIAGYLDKGFPIEFPFVLTFSPDESPIDISQVVDFYLGLLKNYPDYPEQLRRYAIKNLDWSSKMKPVVDYLNNPTNNQ